MSRETQPTEHYSIPDAALRVIVRDEITVGELAARSGVAVSNLLDAANGQRALTGDELTAVVRALGIAAVTS